MKLGVGMVYAKGMLFCGDVVAKNKVDLIFFAPAACNGGDGVVIFAVGVGKYKSVLVGIFSPCAEYLVRKRAKSGFVGRIYTDNRHGPRNDRSLDVFKAFKAKLCFVACSFHGKGVSSALHVVVRKDRTADDGKIGIRADEIVGEHSDKIKLLFKGAAVDLHGCVLF